MSSAVMTFTRGSLLELRESEMFDLPAGLLPAGTRLLFVEYFHNHYDGVEGAIFEATPVDEADAARFFETKDRVILSWRPGEGERVMGTFEPKPAQPWERLRKRRPRSEPRRLPLP